MTRFQRIPKWKWVVISLQVNKPHYNNKKQSKACMSCRTCHHQCDPGVETRCWICLGQISQNRISSIKTGASLDFILQAIICRKILLSMNCATPVCSHHQLQHRAFLKLETLTWALLSGWWCVNINYVNVSCKTIKPYNTKLGSVIVCDADHLKRSRARFTRAIDIQDVVWHVFKSSV